MGAAFRRDSANPQGYRQGDPQPLGSPLPFDTEGADLAVHFSHGCLEVRIPNPEIPDLPELRDKKERDLSIH